MLFQHEHTVCRHTHTHMYTLTRIPDKHTQNSRVLQSDLAKQINKLLIREGKCDWPLTGGSMIYCTCHRHLKVTFTLGW